MYKDTNRRSIIKGISWRVVATATTTTIVYIFFGRLDLAIATGLLESVLKVGLYWAHERIWQKIHWGKEKIEPFNIWLTGLPLSGKSTIGDLVYKELLKLKIPIERIDSKDIRELVPDIGYTREDRNRHLKRIGYLIKTLQNNSVSTVASFVSPYKESREIIKSIAKNTVIVYIKANLESCKARDYKGVYKKALNGELSNFTGVSDVYEEPDDADIVIDTTKLSPQEASNIIVNYVKKRYIK